MKYVVFDTECTGLDRCHADLGAPVSISKAGDEVIEIGGIVLDEEAQPVRCFCHYCDCLKAHSHAQAYAVHHLDLTLIRKHVPNQFLEDVVINLIPELLEDDVTMIGYNTQFDLGMIIWGMRGAGKEFKMPTQVVSYQPRRGRHFIDVMAYLPKRSKLTAFMRPLSGARKQFFKQWAGRLPLETNAPEILEGSWEFAHNALFDSLQTYLLFMDKVWQKKVFRGGDF